MYADLVIIYPKSYSIYLRGTISFQTSGFGVSRLSAACNFGGWILRNFQGGPYQGIIRMTMTMDGVGRKGSHPKP